MNVKCIDHFVITTTDPQAISSFYQKLGFRVTTKKDELVLSVMDFKIHVQTLGQELNPHAKQVQPGSVDICFQLEETAQAIQQMLQTVGIDIELGPVQREGAKGNMSSIYLRDPDGNLIELSSYQG